MMGWSPRCNVTGFVEIGSLVQANKIFAEGFLPDDIWAWRPFWTCDPDAVSKLLFEETLFETVDGLTDGRRTMGIL